MLDRVTWLDRLPARIDGAIVLNEVLDAVPPHVVVRRDGAWLERGVALRDGAARARRAAARGRRAARAGRRRAFRPTVDYASEINPAAEALVGALARRLAHGATARHRLRLPARRVLPPAARRGHADGATTAIACYADVAAAARPRRPHRARRLHRDRRGRRARGAARRRLRVAGRVPARLRHPRGARALRRAGRAPPTCAKPPPCSSSCRPPRWASSSRCSRSRAATTLRGRASRSPTARHACDEHAGVDGAGATSMKVAMK